MMNISKTCLLLVTVLFWVKSASAGDTLLAYSSKNRELIEVKTQHGDIIKVVDVDGLAYHGDMILGYTEELKKHGLKINYGAPYPDDDRIDLQGGIVFPASGYVWPDGIVPYQFASNLSSRSREDMQYAINHWNSRTNLRFVQRSNQRDYVLIQNGSGCSSWIGKQGGRQIVNLANGCGRGAAVHELGHAIGFYHEQTRRDRDDYVTIYWDNIQRDMAYNFEKMSTRDGQTDGDYDFRSIMHYSTDAFSINGRATIWPKVSGVDTDYMGNGRVLSSGDIAAAGTLYGGGEPEPPEPPRETRVSLSQETYTDREPIIVNFSGASGDIYDWIGLYERGAANSAYLSWQFLDGEINGSRAFAALSAGDYEARLFFNDSYILESRAYFSVEASDNDGPTLRAQKSVFSPGERIAISFQNAAGFEYDWIGLYRKGASNPEYISWQYLRQRTDGSVRFRALPPGNYTARLFFNDSYELEAEVDFRVGRD